MNPRRTVRSNTVTTPVLKFFIGLFASMGAVFLPRLTTVLFPDPSGQVTAIIWQWQYVLGAAGFCAFVGVAVMLKEWQVASRPWDTFMSALGIPAVLAGILNVNMDARQLADRAKTETQLNQALSEAAGIPIRPASPAPSSRDDRGEPGLNLAGLQGFLVVPAYASSPGPVEPQFATQVVELKYWVVLHRDAYEQRAKSKAEELKRRLAVRPPGRPEVKIEVLRFGKEFLVVEVGGARARSAATLRAIELKRDFGLQIELQEAPKGA